MTNLNKEQQVAHDTIIDCVANDEVGLITLDSTAGTGKSYTLIQTIKTLIFNQYLLPSEIIIGLANHKQRCLWEKLLRESGIPSDVECFTTHKLLKFFPATDDYGVQHLIGANLDVEALPFRVVILDEAYSLPQVLIEAIYSNGHLLGVLAGDSEQLPPVKERESSIGSTVQDILYELKLTQNMRQKDPELKAIVDTIKIQQGRYKPNFTTKSNFLTDLVEDVDENWEETCFISYYNETVNFVSDFIRQQLFDTKGTRLLPGEYLRVSGIRDGKKVIVPTAEIVQVVSQSKDMSTVIVLFDGCEYVAKIDIKDESPKMLVHAIEKNDKKYWAMYYDKLNSFTTFRHPSVQTCHGVQGSTYENVYLDWKSFTSARNFDRGFWVAASRSSKYLSFCNEYIAPWKKRNNASNKIIDRHRK